MEVINYKADQRGALVDKGSITYCSLNYKRYRADYREPVGDLLCLNDIFLNHRGIMNSRYDAHSTVLLLPIIGGIDIRGGGFEGFAGAEQFLLYDSHPGMQVTVSNSYPGSVINYLEIRLAHPLGLTEPLLQQFNLAHRNTLLPICHTERFNLSLGMFSGRFDGQVISKRPGAIFFFFAIKGIVEVQGRLLHPRDGLSIAGDCIEFEPLADDTIFLCAETSP